MTRFDPILALRLSLADPRNGARAVLGLNLQPGERLGLLALVAILNVLAVELFVRLTPDTPDPFIAAFIDRPAAFAGMQLGGMLLMAGLIHGVGRLFGGQGRMVKALDIVIWLQAILLVLQVGQILAMVLLPPLALVFGLASVGVLLWMLPQFVAELHGFRSAFVTFLGMVGTAAILLVALSLAVAATLSPGT